MTKLFRNVKFLLIWSANKMYSLKDLRLDTPVSLPTMILVLFCWFIFFN
jgi:hypothetical protein